MIKASGDLPQPSDKYVPWPGYYILDGAAFIFQKDALDYLESQSFTHEEALDYLLLLFDTAVGYDSATFGEE